MLRRGVLVVASCGLVELLESQVGGLLALRGYFGLPVVVDSEVGLDRGYRRTVRADPSVLCQVCAVAERLRNFETTLVFVRILH